MSIKKALWWVAFWVGLALCFNLGIYIFMGKEKAFEFLGGYVIEESLSIDNLFLFIMVFASFNIKPAFQRRVLNYGIIGALILRLLFIMLGVTIINMFHWVLYIFGAILIASGIKMLSHRNDEMEDYKDNYIMKLLGKLIPITEGLEGEKFFVWRNRKFFATPLFAILILIEFTDILFAIDSIPAIFSITTDPFIVYASNMFAIMGLRSLYFVLGKLHEKFAFVKYGVSFVLLFTGIKLLILIFEWHIPIEWSLMVIFAILACSVVLSIAVKDKANHNRSKLFSL